MATTENTLAVAPALLTVRVLIAGSDEPVKGLFIAFKLAAANALTKAAKVARVMDVDHEKDFKDKRYQRLQEQYKAQEAENVADPSDQFVLGITDVDGYLEPVYESSNPWRDRLTRLEPDSFKFAVDEEYNALYIRHPSPGVARAATRLLNGGASGRTDVDFSNTKVWGAMPGAVQLARFLGYGGPALQKFKVEKGSGKDGEQFVIHVPATPKAYVPLRTDDAEKWWLYAGMPHESLASVRQQVYELVDSLGVLKYPATGDQDTPYSVNGVEDAIEKTRNSKNMTEDAKQKRVHSLTEALYSFHGPLQAVAGRFQEHLAEGRAFQPVDWERAHAPSQWASEIGADVSFPPVETPRLEQGGVIGPNTAKYLDEWKTKKWVKPPQHLVTIGNGVLMLARGAFAFNAWSELAKVLGCEYGMSSGHSYRQLMAEGGGGAIKNSIHKTGLASDMTGGRQRTSTEKWPIRFEAEFRRVKPDATVAGLEAKVTEKQAALDAAITAREADRTAAQKGVTAASKEKDDLLSPERPKKATKNQITAADAKIRDRNKTLAGIDKKHEPKIIKATKEREAAQKAVDDAKSAIHTDGYRLPDRWRMRFRLFGHSTADVFHADQERRDAELKRLKGAIAQWAGIPWPPEEPVIPESGGEFLKFLKRSYLEGIASHAADDWLREQFKPVYLFANELIALSDKDLIDRYFRATITQWRVNFYELDGGTDALQPQAPNEGDADFPARANARSWLNISALGHGCQMHRIQPHKWETRDRTFFAKDPEKVPPMAFPMEAYLRFEESKAEQGDLVAAIEDITASHEQAPELAHANYKIEFREPTGKKKETEVAETAMPNEIDTTFFKEWRRKVNPWKKIKKVPLYVPGSKGVYLPKGAQVSIVLNELNPERQEGLQSVLNFFRTDFPKNRFVLMESGPFVDDDLPKGKIFTGIELADAAAAALVRLSAEATAAAQKAAEEAAAAKLAAQKAAAEMKGKKAKKVKKQDVPKPPKTKVEDWSLLIQPVFSLEQEKPKLLFLPEHIVMLPARENGAHLEWWHFQHHSVKKARNWSDLLEECGYSRAVMKTPAEGELDPTGEPVHIGLGYSVGKRGELDSTPWPNAAEIDERPSNYDTGHDEAVEDEEVYIE